MLITSQELALMEGDTFNTIQEVILGSQKPIGIRFQRMFLETLDKSLPIFGLETCVSRKQTSVVAVT